MSLENKIHLRPEEQIVEIIRRYGLTLLVPFILSLVLFLLDFYLLFRLINLGTIGIVLFVIVGALAALLLARVLYLRRANYLVVTTRRIVDVERRSAFDEVMSDLPYDQMGDISVRTKGFWGMIFKYGSLKISALSGTVNIIVNYVNKPAQVKQLMNDLRRDYLQSGHDAEPKFTTDWKKKGNEELSQIAKEISEELKRRS